MGVGPLYALPVCRSKAVRLRSLHPSRMSAANHFVQHESGVGFVRPTPVPAAEVELAPERQIGEPAGGAASARFQVAFRTVFVWFASLVALADGALSLAAVGLAGLCTAVWSVALLRTYATSDDQGKPQLLQVLGDTTFGVKAFLIECPVEERVDHPVIGFERVRLAVLLLNTAQEGGAVLARDFVKSA